MCKTGTTDFESLKIGRLFQRASTVLFNAFPVDVNNDDLSLSSGYITITGSPSVLIP